MSVIHHFNANSDCDRAQDVIFMLLDPPEEAGLPHEEDLAFCNAHLAVCEACREYQQETTQLLQAFETLETVVLPGDADAFCDRVLERVAASPKTSGARRPGMRPWAWLPVAGVAAAVLVILSFPGLPGPQPVQKGISIVAVKTAEPPATPPRLLASAHTQPAPHPLHAEAAPAAITPTLAPKTLTTQPLPNATPVPAPAAGLVATASRIADANILAPMAASAPKVPEPEADALDEPILLVENLPSNEREIDQANISSLYYDPVGTLVGF